MKTNGEQVGEKEGKYRESNIATDALSMEEERWKG